MITNTTSKAFPPALSFVGYLFMAIGVYAVIFASIGGILVILLGILFSFSRNGTQVDREKKRVREYTQYFGLKTGDWQSLDNYPYLTVLKRHYKSITFSYPHIAGTTSANTYYDICLLSGNHRKRIIIKRHQDPNAANTEAEELASILEKEITSYDPEVSESTRNRRYR